MNAPGVNQEWGDSYLFQIGMLKSLDQERDTFHSDGDVGFMSSDAGLTYPRRDISEGDRY